MHENHHADIHINIVLTKQTKHRDATENVCVGVSVCVCVGFKVCGLHERYHVTPIPYILMC